MGKRIVMPQVLDKLRQCYIGIVKMKHQEEGVIHVWWRGIDRDIELLSTSLAGCQEVKHASTYAPIHPWDWLSRQY